MLDKALLRNYNVEILWADERQREPESGLEWARESQSGPERARLKSLLLTAHNAQKRKEDWLKRWDKEMGRLAQKSQHWEGNFCF